MNYAKWKKPDSKDYILYTSIYMTFWKRENYRDCKQINACHNYALVKTQNCTLTRLNVYTLYLKKKNLWKAP